MVAFSRPFYFCALASVVLILDEAARANLTEFTLYGLPLCTQSTLTYTRDFLLGKGSRYRLQGASHSKYKYTILLGKRA